MRGMRGMREIQRNNYEDQQCGQNVVGIFEQKCTENGQGRNNLNPISPGRFNTLSTWAESAPFLTLLPLIQIKPSLVW